MLRCKLCRAEKHITIENFGQSFYETSQLEYVVFIHLMNQSSPGGGGVRGLRDRFSPPD